MVIYPTYGRIQCFLAPGDFGRQTLVVAIWGKGAKITLYGGSHKMYMQPIERGFMELSPSQLSSPSIRPNTIHLEDGGL